MYLVYIQTFRLSKENFFSGLAYRPHVSGENVTEDAFFLKRSPECAVNDYVTALDTSVNAHVLIKDGTVSSHFCVFLKMDKNREKISVL